MAARKGGGASQGGTPAASGAAGSTRPADEVRAERRITPAPDATAQQPVAGVKPVAVTKSGDDAPKRKGKRPKRPIAEAEQTRDAAPSLKAPDNGVAKLNEADRAEVVSPMLDADLERRLKQLARQRAVENAAAAVALSAASRPPARAEQHKQTAQRPPASSPDVNPDSDLSPQQIAERERSNLPPELAARYLREGEKIYDKGDVSKVAFVDRGEVLKTTGNNIDTVHAIVTLAESRGWNAIKTTGTAAFRREVYIEASARGMQVAGYTPTQEDLREISLRAEKHIERNSVARVDARKVAATVPALAVVNEALRRKAQSSPDPEAAARVQDRVMQQLGRDVAAGVARGDTPREIQVKVPQGVYLEAGPAKYNFDPQERDSFYVRYQDDAGVVKTRWGKGLQQALIDAKVQPGDTIRLQREGARTVQVAANVRDQNNRVVRSRTIDAQRNEWKVEVVERRVEQEMRPPARSARAR